MERRPRKSTDGDETTREARAKLLRNVSVLCVVCVLCVLCVLCCVLRVVSCCVLCRPPRGHQPSETEALVQRLLHGPRRDHKKLDVLPLPDLILVLGKKLGAPASFFAELRKLGDKEARHIVSRGLLCEEPSAGLLADVEHRLAAAREDQKKANQRVAVHYSLWEQAKQFTKSTGLTWVGERG